MVPMSSVSRLLCVALAVCAASCSSNNKKHPMSMQEMVAADPLPLRAGAKWTYAVTVKRFDAEADKETTKTLTWVTEVVDAREANGVIAYRVKGWPTDLADFDGSAAGPKATEKTILRSGNNFLFGASAEATLWVSSLICATVKAANWAVDKPAMAVVDKEERRAVKP